ncbi:hypothetical protein AOLI_G00244970 [Acnodon oligacanthus]
MKTSGWKHHSIISGISPTSIWRCDHVVPLWLSLKHSYLFLPAVGVETLLAADSSRYTHRCVGLQSNTNTGIPARRIHAAVPQKSLKAFRHQVRLSPASRSESSLWQGHGKGWDSSRSIYEEMTQPVRPSVNHREMCRNKIPLINTSNVPSQMQRWLHQNSNRPIFSSNPKRS